MGRVKDVKGPGLWVCVLGAAITTQACSCDPAVQLVFTAAPTTATAGQQIPSRFTVAFQDRTVRITPDPNPVELTVNSGPAGATITGTTKRSASPGFAHFADLSFEKAGIYTLRATAGSLPPAISPPFVVEAAAQEKLGFVVEPIDTAINRSMTPPVQVGILDHFGNVTHGTGNVQMALAANPGGGTLHGTTQVTAVDGISTFSDLSLDANGVGYQLAASSGSLTPATSQPFTIADPHLVYTNPTGGKVRLVRDDAASTNAVIVLRLEAATTLAGYSIGMNLPLTPGPLDPASLVFTPGDALPPGLPPSVLAYGAKIPTSGPLGSTLVTGQSQKPTGNGAVAADAAIASGALFYSFKVAMPASPVFGVVFDGASLGPKFRASLRDRQGNEVVSQTDFAIGRLEVR